MYIILFVLFFFFFFNDTATTEIYTLSLHDALPISVVDLVIDRFYSQVLGPYWPPERRHVDDGYRSLPFPFEQIQVPGLAMRASWTRSDLIGYVETWSAVWGLERAAGPAPLEAFRRELAHAWGAGAAHRPVRWTLSLRVGRL